MKSQVKILMAMLVAAAAVGATIVPNSKPAEEYNPERVQGDVRVVLIEVSKVTMFGNENLRNHPDKGSAIVAVPGMRITYLIESLGEEPLKTWGTLSAPVVTVTGSGESVTRHVAENIVPGGTDFQTDYSNFHGVGVRLPQVTNNKRALVRVVWQRGVRARSSQIDIKLNAGFNEHREKFVFQNVPLD
jgi:hypothetical protein